MKTKFLFLLLFFLYFFFFLPQKANAIDCPFRTDPNPVVYTIDSGAGNSTPKYKLIFNTQQIPKEIETKYPEKGRIVFNFPDTLFCGQPIVKEITKASDAPTSAETSSDSCNYLKNSGTHKVELLYQYDQTVDNKIEVQSKILCSATYELKTEGPSCNFTVERTDGIGDINSIWKIKVSDISVGTKSFIRYIQLRLMVNGEIKYKGDKYDGDKFEFSINNLPPPRAYVRVVDREEFKPDYLMCGGEFEISEKNIEIPKPTIQSAPSPTETPIPTPTEDPACNISDPKFDCRTKPYDTCISCRPKPTKPVPSPPPLTQLCDQLTTNNQYRSLCQDCVDKKHGAWSALGCLPISYTGFVGYIFNVGVAFAGGIAFLYFLWGAFKYLTSSGNAEKIEEAKQIITSSLAGIILIIFSIFLLKIIGVDILGIFAIPNF
ncbi:hypothetical protein HY029_05575 [Candidatus Gottesmanbacteria bacterium]|nr:hypothetical protein [Candidatus Gottesmanbacteria bacterium]